MGKCGILFSKASPNKSKESDKNSSYGIQIKVIHNYKAEINMNSTKYDSLLYYFKEQTSCPSCCMYFRAKFKQSLFLFTG